MQALTDDLMAGREGDEVSEALESDRVAIVDCVLNGLGEGNEACRGKSFSSRRPRRSRLRRRGRIGVEHLPCAEESQAPSTNGTSSRHRCTYVVQLHGLQALQHPSPLGNSTPGDDGAPGRQCLDRGRPALLPTSDRIGKALRSTRACGPSRSGGAKPVPQAPPERPDPVLPLFGPRCLTTSEQHASGRGPTRDEAVRSSPVLAAGRGVKGANCSRWRISSLAGSP